MAEVPVVSPLQNCLPPRPVLPPVELVPGGEADCPDAFAVCIDPLNSARLELRDRRLRLYVREAQLGCDPAVDGGAHD